MTPGDHPWDEDDPAWPVHDTAVTWETPFFEAGHDEVERPSGERATYYWLDPGDAAVVVPITDDGEVVMIEQYRPRLRRHTLGLPGGNVEDDDPPDAARRELREETGYTADELTKIGTYVPTPLTRYVRHVFVARDLTAGAPETDDGEFIEIERVPAADAIDRVRNVEGPANGVALGPLLLAREEGVL